MACRLPRGVPGSDVTLNVTRCQYRKQKDAQNTRFKFRVCQPQQTHRGLIVVQEFAGCHDGANDEALGPHIHAPHILKPLQILKCHRHTLHRQAGVDVGCSWVTIRYQTGA